MDSWELYQYISDICPPIEVVDQFVFLNRNGLSASDFRAQLAEYRTLMDAQQWINLVPVDDFLSEVIEEWSIDDPNIPLILGVYSRSWLAACARAGFEESLFNVVCLKDRETGDVAFRLEQKHSDNPSYSSDV